VSTLPYPYAAEANIDGLFPDRGNLTGIDAREKNDYKKKKKNEWIFSRWLFHVLNEWPGIPLLEPIRHSP